MVMDTIAALLQWWQGLDGLFRFLLLLPFAVAAAGLAVDGRADSWLRGVRGDARSPARPRGTAARPRP